MQMVENVEKHLLGSTFSSQKLDVIDDQYIHLHVKVCKRFDVSIFNAIHKLIDKFFWRNIEYKLFIRTIFDFISDGLYEMRFS